MLLLFSFTFFLKNCNDFAFVFGKRKAIFFENVNPFALQTVSLVNLAPGAQPS